MCNLLISVLLIISVLSANSIVILSFVCRLWFGWFTINVLEFLAIVNGLGSMNASYILKVNWLLLIVISALNSNSINFSWISVISSSAV